MKVSTSALSPDSIYLFSLLVVEYKYRCRFSSCASTLDDTNSKLFGVQKTRILCKSSEHYVSRFTRCLWAWLFPTWKSWMIWLGYIDHDGQIWFALGCWPQRESEDSLHTLQHQDGTRGHGASICLELAITLLNTRDDGMLCGPQHRRLTADIYPLDNWQWLLG